jgi:hypothetical protein
MSTGTDYAPSGAALKVMEAVHALNGKPTEGNVLTFQRIIKDFQSDDVVVGIALHALVDSIFHSYRDPETGVAYSYKSPAGHGAKGSQPDYISEDQALDAARQVMIALENVSGTTMPQGQQVQTLNSVKAAVDLAREQTSEQFEAGGMFGFLRGSDTRDINYRRISERLLGQNSSWAKQILRPNEIEEPSLGENKFTYEMSIQQAAAFLGTAQDGVSKWSAKNFLRESLSGLNRFMDIYSSIVDARSLSRSFDSQLLFDTEGWYGGVALARVTRDLVGKSLGQSFGQLFSRGLSAVGRIRAGSPL